VSRDLIQTFREQFEGEPEFGLFSPGRVNLIGEHIDYCGGLVLPMAIDRGTFGLVSGNDSDLIRIQSTRFSKSIEISLSEKKTNSHWSDFVVGVVCLLGKQYSLSGFNICVDDNISAGGLSSSASFSILLAMAALKVAGIGLQNDAEKLSLARLCRQVENDFVGLSCGIMDQASVVLGGVIRLDCEELSFSRINIDFQDHQLVIIDSGKERTLAGSKYNQRVNEINEILALLQMEYALDNLCALTTDELDRAARFIGDEKLVRRMRHVVSENARVNRATLALEAGDLGTFGGLLSESHESLRMDYEVTGFELDTLVEISRSQAGVLGARMTGAGFGGCCIALVEKSRVEEHNRQVEARYLARTGLTAKFILANESAGAGDWPVQDFRSV